MADELYRLGDRAKAVAGAEAALAILEQIEDPNVAKVREELARWREEGQGEEKPGT